MNEKVDAFRVSLEGEKSSKVLTVEDWMEPEFSFSHSVLGCQIFLDTVYQNGGKDTKWPKMYQMAKHAPNGQKCT
jgi:hypothetical protein